MTDAISAVFVFLILGGLMGAVRFWDKRRNLHPELARKLIHVGMGVVTLAFPWLFSSAISVFLVAAGATATLVAVRTLPRLGGVGNLLHGVTRKSLGEFYFPFGVAILFFASEGEPALYWPPLLLLTFADALAALAGVAFGSRRYTTDDGVKTVEGSAAFFLVAFVATAFSLGLWSSLDWPRIIIVSLLLGLIGVLLEAIAWRGLDNLFIPVLGFLFLDAFLELGFAELGWRLGALAGLILFTHLWKRRTTLNDSALLGSALFGYLAIAVGGPSWTIPPLLLFLFYPRLVPYLPDQRGNSQPAAGVLSVAAPGLFWLLFHRLTGDPLLLFSYSFTFAAHLGIIWVARWLEGGEDLSLKRLLVHAIFSTGLVVILPLGFEIELTKGLYVYFAGTLFGTALACQIATHHFSKLKNPGEPVPGCWIFRGSLVFALSLILHLAIVAWNK